MRSGVLATWNAGECCSDARDKNIDDVGFMAAVIERVAQSASIDRKRIYVTGMSNGAMMFYRLARERADFVRAIAPVAGTQNTNACAPSAPIPVLHIHALDDTHLLFEGGAGEDAFRDRSKVTDFTSLPATIRKWAAFDEADPKSTRVLKMTAHGASFTRRKKAARLSSYASRKPAAIPGRAR